MGRVVTSVKELDSNDERCRWFDGEKISYEVTMLNDNVLEKQVSHADDEDFQEVIEQFKKYLDKRIEKLNISKEELGEKKVRFFLKNSWIYALLFLVLASGYYIYQIPVEIFLYSEILGVGLTSIFIIGGLITTALIDNEYKNEDNKLKKDEEKFKKQLEKCLSLKQKGLDITMKKIQLLEQEKKRQQWERKELEKMRYRQLEKKTMNSKKDELSKEEQMLYNIHYGGKDLDIPEYLKRQIIRNKLTIGYNNSLRNNEEQSKKRR